METAKPQSDPTREADATQAMTPDELSFAAAIEGDDALLLPPEIKVYRIIRRIGAGGMGSVYEAEQANPRRLVALKIMRPESLSAERLRRFQHEGEILGRLHHPGIAQIYEAGTFDSPMGPRPFFAMELIRGTDLHSYARHEKLDEKRCMELLSQICDAVQHAHDAGIIHRDLKPDNILVDESGQPKILDFGVARVAEGESRNVTQQTRIGVIIGTVAYMSPEQAAGNSAEIDARSDVFTLGVIGYLLLCDKMPHEIEGMPLVDAIRMIREDQPTPLSSINRLCRGDLETIIGKALDKEKGRRYQTAAEFAADIRRWLHDEPIVARPPSTFYQLKKFAQRNKPLVAGVILAFVALALGLVGTTWQATNARRERDRADAEAVKSREEARRSADMFRFSMDMLGGALRKSDRGETFSPVGLLDSGADLVGERFTNDAVARMGLHFEIGSLYQTIPRSEEAIKHFDLALGCADTLTSPPQLLLAGIFAARGSVGYNTRHDSESIEYSRRGAELMRRIKAPSNDRLDSEVNYFLALTNSHQYSEALDLARRWLIAIPKDDPDARRVRSRYLAFEAFALCRLNRQLEADAPSDEALGIVRSLDLGKDEMYMWYGWPVEARMQVLAQLGRGEEVTRLFNELRPLVSRSGSLLLQERLLMGYSGHLERKNPAGDEALEIKREVLSLTRPLYGEKSMKTVFALSDLVKTCWLRNDMDQYGAYATEALGIMRDKLGPDSPELISRLNDYTNGLMLKGRRDLAVTMLDTYMPLIEAKGGRNNPDAAKLFAIWDRQKKSAPTASSPLPPVQ